MAKILYIRPACIESEVERWLRLERHLVEFADTGSDGLQLSLNFDYDVILLDFSLPDMTGFDLLEKYREAGRFAWIIVFSNAQNIGGIEILLDSGADDCMCKPVDLRELSARIRRSLRRSATSMQVELRDGDLVLNVSSRSLRIGHQDVALTQKETALLEYLMRHPNHLVNTSKLLSAVWPSGATASSGTVRTVVYNLRQKLGAAGREDFIDTVLGSGYTIKMHGTARSSLA